MKVFVTVTLTHWDLKGNKVALICHHLVCCQNHLFQLHWVGGSLGKLDILLAEIKYLRAQNKPDFELVRG